MTRPKFRRTIEYGLATLGPIGSAGAQFVLSFQLLHALDPQAFGTFSFLLIVSQLSLIVASALVCAPFPVLLSRPQADARAVMASFHAATLALAVVAGVVCGFIGLALGLPLPIAFIFACYASVMLVRWFGRSYGYARGTQLNTVASDLAYGGMLLLVILAMFFSGQTSLDLAYGGLLLSAVVALVPLGGAFLKGQFGRPSLKAFGDYREVWRGHSRWALSGVVTTELTVNAHAYAVTFIAGAMAFAPLAASALLVRPISLASNALTDFERPRMARKLNAEGISAAAGSMHFFAGVLLAVWLGSALLAVGVMYFIPDLVLPAQYSAESVVLGCILWFAVMLIRTLRTPSNVLLQAAGEFRQLAFASYVSCGVSVIAVLVLIQAFGPVWSIAGLGIGDLVFAALTVRAVRKWRSAHHAPSAQSA